MSSQKLEKNRLGPGSIRPWRRGFRGAAILSAFVLVLVTVGWSSASPPAGASSEEPGQAAGTSLSKTDRSRVPRRKVNESSTSTPASASSPASLEASTNPQCAIGPCACDHRTKIGISGALVRRSST